MIYTHLIDDHNSPFGFAFINILNLLQTLNYSKGYNYHDILIIKCSKIDIELLIYRLAGYFWVPAIGNKDFAQTKRGGHSSRAWPRDNKLVSVATHSPRMKMNCLLG